MSIIKQNYGFSYSINRQGLVSIRDRNGVVTTLGETRSRVVLSALMLASIAEGEQPHKGAFYATLIDNLFRLVTGSLKGETMKRVFDTLHILKVEVGDHDVDSTEIAQRLVMKA